MGSTFEFIMRTHVMVEIRRVCIMSARVPTVRVNVQMCVCVCVLVCRLTSRAVNSTNIYPKAFRAGCSVMQRTHTH